MKTIKVDKRGGARPGAGRKAGSANLKTREIADRVIQDGNATPLEIMVGAMCYHYRKAWFDGGKRREKPDEAHLNEAGRFAQIAGPYIHPRLANRDTPLRIGPLTGELQYQGKQVLAALSEGKLTPGEAATVMQTIASQATIAKTGELEKRIAALEERASPPGGSR